MFVKITDACLYNGGTHADQGETVNVSADTAAALVTAGRGYVVPAPVAEPPAAPEKGEVDPVEPPAAEEATDATAAKKKK